MKMSVSIIYNKCVECKYARPSNAREYLLYCLKRKIYKKSNRKCNMWAEIKPTRMSLAVLQSSDKAEAYQAGIEHERQRMYVIRTRRGE